MAWAVLREYYLTVILLVTIVLLVWSNVTHRSTPTLVEQSGHERKVDTPVSYENELEDTFEDFISDSGALDDSDESETPNSGASEPPSRETPTPARETPAPARCHLPSKFDFVSTAGSMAALYNLSNTQFVPITLNDDKDCVVYTIFVGGYEKSLKRYRAQTVSCHWVAFTDNTSLKGNASWMLRSVPPLFKRLRLTKRHRGYLITKFLKMLPFFLFPSFIRFAVYVDGTYVINGPTFVEGLRNMTGGPILIRKHSVLSSIARELQATLPRYRGVGTSSILIKQFIAHVSEGLCDHWEDPQQMTRIAASSLSRILSDEYCTSKEPEAQKLASSIATEILTNIKTPCLPCAPQKSALPRLPEDVLRFMPPSGPPMPLYDASLIAFHLDLPSRPFAEAFLKQWFLDSAFTGKDQLPLMYLLWRTPGYFPQRIPDKYYSTGMMARQLHGK